MLLFFSLKIYVNINASSYFHNIAMYLFFGINNGNLKLWDLERTWNNFLRKSSEWIWGFKRKT